MNKLKFYWIREETEIYCGRSIDPKPPVVNS